MIVDIAPSRKGFILLQFLNVLMSVAIAWIIWAVLKNTIPGYKWTYNPLIVAPLLAMYSAFLQRKKYLSGMVGSKRLITGSAAGAFAYALAYYMVMYFFDKAV